MNDFNTNGSDSQWFNFYSLSSLGYSKLRRKFFTIWNICRLLNHGCFPSFRIHVRSQCRANIFLNFNWGNALVLSQSKEFYTSFYVSRDLYGDTIHIDVQSMEWNEYWSNDRLDQYVFRCAADTEKKVKWNAYLGVPFEHNRLLWLLHIGWKNITWRTCE